MALFNLLKVPWMNELCLKCKYFCKESGYSFYSCKAPYSKEWVDRSIRNQDGSLNYRMNDYYYGNLTNHIEPHLLPCFEPKPQPPQWRLPIAIILGVVLSPLFSFGFLLVGHMGFADVGFPPLPGFLVAIGILVGCSCGIAVAIAWYRKEIWQDLWQK